MADEINGGDSSVHSNGCSCMMCSMVNRDNDSNDQDSQSSVQTFSTSDNNISSLLLGFSWGGTVGQAVTVTYTTSVATGDLPSESYGMTNGAVFNSAQLQAFNESLAAFSNVANITFQEVASESDADIIARQGDLTPGIAGWVVPSYIGTYMVQADLVLDTDYNTDPTAGSFSYMTVLHELGHALGLAHPHDGEVIDDASLDTNDYTIMSYNAGPITGVFSKTPITPMILDIQALQYLYGANTSYNSGDTILDLSDANSVVQTIWDGGGTDTVDTSAYSGAVTVDLREGVDYISTIGDSNAWMAYGANIENANSGSGTDYLQGNSLNNYLQSGEGNDTVYGEGGDDSLEGAGGNDYTQGNLGNDTVYGGDGNDTVLGGKDSDFINGNAGNDYVNGNIGNDTVQGGKDNDTVVGGQDDDYVNGNLGDDLVNGNKGNDVVRGGQGNDIVLGGEGNDTIMGDKGNDILYGEDGSDVFLFASESGADTISDFSSNDVLYISSALASSSTEAINQSSVLSDNLLIVFGSGDSITLTGVTSLSLDNIIIY